MIDQMKDMEEVRICDKDPTEAIKVGRNLPPTMKESIINLWRFSSASAPNLQIPPPLRLGRSSLLRLLYLSPDSSLLCPFFLSHSLSVRQPPSSPTVATTLSFFPIIFSLERVKAASLIVKAWKESDDRSDMKVRLGGMAPMNDEREWFKKEAFKWGVQLFHPLLPHKPNQEILQSAKTYVNFSSASYLALFTAMVVSALIFFFKLSEQASIFSVHLFNFCMGLLKLYS
ncbi:hypothetical protein G4B88_019095 [Cannabis sativa]|uniref:Thiaminase-2/PQQC domain-containing protein n=1 Tax=Cannabis sativa TaxID=3483 RepID=A0A7J6H173_CANSA|nr:hypothetical protein G4B88_019095 [Cannabis sativa]